MRLYTIRTRIAREFDVLVQRLRSRLKSYLATSIIQELHNRKLKLD